MSAPRRLLPDERKRHVGRLRATEAPARRRRADRRGRDVGGDHGPRRLDLLQPAVLDAVLRRGDAVRLPGVHGRDPGGGQRHRRDGARVAERRRLLHLRDARPRAAGRVHHRRADVRRLRAAPAGRARPDRLLPAEHAAHRGEHRRPMVADRDGSRRRDDRPGRRGHPGIAAHGAGPVRHRGVRGRAAGVHRGRARWTARTVAPPAEPHRFTPRLPRAGHRVRVRSAQLRRLRGRGDTRRRGARPAPPGSRGRYCSAAPLSA